MLEMIVPSRIRRALFEHLLAHPSDRFYLRGLAKTLNLSVSPLRRELKRLEHAGMLTAVQEGNMLFYHVNMASPEFLQLNVAQGSRLKAEGNSLEPPASSLQPIQIGVISAPPKISNWRSPLSRPMLVGTVAVGLALVLIVTVLSYMTMTNQRLIAQTSRVLATQKAEIATPQASGAMQGRRWKVVPGGFGGFSSGANHESY